MGRGSSWDLEHVCKEIRKKCRRETSGMNVIKASGKGYLMRRHHRKRLARKRLRNKYWYFAREAPKKGHLQISIDTPKTCSCWMCGNPRRMFLEKTRQEKISLQSFSEQLSEICI